MQASESLRFITRFPIELLIKEKLVLTEADFQQIRAHFYHIFKIKLLKWTRGWPSPLWGTGMMGMPFFTLVLGGDMQQNMANCYNTVDSKTSTWPLCWCRTLTSLTCARQDPLKCWIVRVGLWEDRGSWGLLPNEYSISLFILHYWSGV